MSTRKTRHITTVEATFDGSELLQLLGLPLTARLYVRVPGGGDWSNTDLSIDAGTPLQASWSDVTEEGS